MYADSSAFYFIYWFHISVVLALWVTKHRRQRNGVRVPLWVDHKKPFYNPQAKHGAHGAVVQCVAPPNENTGEQASC